MCSLFSHWGEIYKRVWEREGDYQRYKDKRREMEGASKTKRESSERGGEMYDTGQLLENKKEERQWIAAPLQTDTWWMGPLPKKPACVCSPHSVHVCVWEYVCVTTKTIHLGHCGSDHSGEWYPVSPSPPTRRNTTVSSINSTRGQLSNLTAGN